LVKRIFKYIHNRWSGICLAVILPIAVISLVLFPGLLTPFTDQFKKIAESPKLFYVIIVASGVWGIIHLILVSKKGVAKEHLLFKKVGPMLAAPLTCLTYGVFIHASIQIIYIFCYDSNTMLKYESLDKTTITFVMLSIVTYSFHGMSLIIMDIINWKDVQAKQGQVMEEDKTAS
tara:strand:+ start:36728 stop:37252 length:525 start_codon:yes stop_codon:yes gene_type:complete